MNQTVCRPNDPGEIEFMKPARRFTVIFVGLSLVASGARVVRAADAPRRDDPYVELEGRAEDFRFIRHWRFYYWRDDITFVLRDKAGKRIRVISREPTPWNNLRLGTTYTGLKVDWKQRPHVRVIGVRAVDRVPAEFHDVKLDPENTVTAFIVRVRSKGRKQKEWQDYYVNNWFHHWGMETDRKMLPHFATKDPNYTVYGYLKGIAAPFDDAGKKLLEKFSPDYGGIIYHARVVKADNPVGYELRVLHLMGRHKRTRRYQVFHGDAKKLTPLDQRRPKSPR